MDETVARAGEPAILAAAREYDEAAIEHARSGERLHAAARRLRELLLNADAKARAGTPNPMESC